LKDLGIDGRKLKYMLKKHDGGGRGGAEWIHIHNGQTAASCALQGRIDGRVRWAADQDTKL